MFDLICVIPFGMYQKGQRVSDRQEVERLMASHDHHFVRVASLPAPTPAPKK